MLLAALALSTTISTCSWNNPGADPYMGRFEDAIDRYEFIDEDVRARLKAKVAAHEYDDMVEIKRDEIHGRQEYSNELSNMNFGKGRVCVTVDRSGWKPEHVERGLVFCVDGTCILIPTVCRNVTVITRLQRLTGGASAGPLEGQTFGLGPAPVSPPTSLPVDDVTYGLSATPVGPSTFSSPPMLYQPIVVPPLPPLTAIPVVPEPSSLWLMLVGLAMIAVRKLRR
jgi:hypothetical protein